MEDFERDLAPPPGRKAPLRAALIAGLVLALFAAGMLILVGGR